MIEWMKYHLSDERLSYYVRKITENFWPNGQWSAAAESLTPEQAAEQLKLVEEMIFAEIPGMYAGANTCVRWRANLDNRRIKQGCVSWKKSSRYSGSHSTGTWTAAKSGIK